MAILQRSLEPRDEKLREIILGWHTPPEPVVLARQLIALAALSCEGSRHLAAHIPSIYHQLSDAMTASSNGLDRRLVQCEVGTSSFANTGDERSEEPRGAAGCRDFDSLDRLDEEAVTTELVAGPDVERGERGAAAAGVAATPTAAADNLEEATPGAATLIVVSDDDREKKKVSPHQLSPEMLLAQSLLLHERWIWLDGGFVTARAVALSHGDDLQPYLFKLPQRYIDEFGPLFVAFGVREAFEAADLAEATRKMFHVHGDEKLNESQLRLALSLARLLAKCDEQQRAYLPDSAGRLGFAGEMAFDDAAWLGPTLRGRLRLCDATLTHEEARFLGAR
jgi:hypothetical protein